VELDFTGERIVEGKTPAWIVAHHIARYRFAATFCRHKRVLDAGCGTGYGSFILHREGTAKQVVGADICEEAIAHAASKYAMEGLEFHVQDISDPQTLGKYFEGRFDVIVAFELIEHVLRPRAALLAMRKLLSPGGILIVSTPNRVFNSPWIPSWEEPLNAFHIREFSRREFKALVKRQFSIAGVYGQCVFPGRYFGAIVRDYIHSTLQSRFSADHGWPVRRLRFYEEAHTITLVCRPARPDALLRRLRRKTRDLLLERSLSTAGHRAK